MDILKIIKYILTEPRSSLVEGGEKLDQFQVVTCR